MTDGRGDPAARSSGPRSAGRRLAELLGLREQPGQGARRPVLEVVLFAVAMTLGLSVVGWQSPLDTLTRPGSLVVLVVAVLLYIGVVIRRVRPRRRSRR